MMKKKYILLFLSLISFICFLALSKYEDRALIRTMDFAVTVRVQDAITKYCPVRCDNFLSGVSEFAGPFVASFFVVWLTGFFFYDSVKKRVHMWALLIPIFFIIMALVEIYGKNAVSHPAPPFFMIKNPTAIFPTYHVSADFSYPSGHAARAVFISILGFSAWTIRIAHKKVRSQQVLVGVVFVFFVSLVSLSKVYFGHHWFSDIVGGAFLACSLAFGALVFAPVDARDKADYNRKVHE